MTIKIFKRLKLFFCSVILSVKGFAQVSNAHFTISLANINSTTNTIDFDLMMNVDGNTILSNGVVGMRFSGITTGINFNDNIINGGSVSLTYLGNRDVSISGIVINKLNTSTTGHIRIVGTPLTPSNSINVANGVYKIGRYRLTNSQSWVQNSNAQFWFQPVIFSNKSNTGVVACPYGTNSGNSFAYTTTSPITNSGVSFGSVSQSSPISVLLNSQICATTATQSSSTPVTCFDGSDGKSTITLTPTPTLSLISYTVDGGNSQSTTLLGNSFTISGLNAGNHTVSISNSGCPNIEALGISINSPSILTNLTTISACDSYTWSVNGISYNSSGTYSAINNNGQCPIQETLSLTINNSTSSSQSVTACDSYTWSVNNVTYTTGGAKTFTSTNTAGCPDTKTLILTINDSTSSSSSATACDNYAWLVNNVTYTTGGTKTFTSTNTAGCPDVKTLVLTINSSTSSSASDAACDSYIWSVNNVTYTMGGTKTFTSTNAAGCPDVKTLVLTINNSTSSSSSVTACDSYIWSANNLTYTTGGTKTFTSTNTSGCPNTKTLNLTINNSTSSSQTVTSCGSYTWQVNGQAYVTSGIKTYSSFNSSGCPDTKTLNLTIIPNTSSLTTITACDSYLWLENGQTYTSSGSYSVSSGCNTSYLDLTINSSNSSSEIATGCGSYIWLVNGQTYTSSGTYTFTGISASGCTYIKTLVLTISNDAIINQPVNTTICSALNSLANFTVASFAVGATYTWQYRVVTSTAPNPNWTTITSSNSGLVYTNYTSPTLTVKRATSLLPEVGTQYRVLIDGVCGQTISDSANITIVTTVNSGTITSPSSVCLSGNISLTLGGYSGTSLQWQSALSSTSTFANIPGATNQVYTINGATTTMNKSYRVVVTNSCNNTTATSVIKTIVVNPKSISGIVTGGGTVCLGSSSTLKLSGYVGTIQWQYSTDGLNYINAPKSTDNQISPFGTSSTTSSASTYVSTGILQNVFFRTKVTSGSCSIVYSDPVQYILGTAVVGIASTAASGSICSGSGTTVFLTGNNVGVITWQKNTNLVTPSWTNISNSNVTNLSTGNLTVSTMYRASVTIGSCSTIISNDVTVSLVPKPVAKSITSTTTTPSGTTSTLALCANFSVAKILTVGSGYVGTIQWQSSITSTTSGFTNILGANGQSYTINQASVGVNYFRAVFTNSCGVSVNGSAVTLYYKDCGLAKETTPDLSVKRSFEIIAYPNPYSQNFKLNIKSLSNQKIDIKIYDIIGKLIEVKEIEVWDEMIEQKFGDQYPSGLYNLIATQGNKVKIIKVIKQ